MKLENQVCAAKQAKKLNDLGISQGLSLFYWNPEVLQIQTNGDEQRGFSGAQYYFSMFTAAELAVMIPDYKPSLGNLQIGKCETDHITNRPQKKKWYNVSYWVWDGTPMFGHYCPQKKTVHLHQAPTLAEALGALLIYLLENEFVTAPEVNARLEREETARPHTSSP